MVIDDNGSVEGIYAFIYCTKWRFGEVSRCSIRPIVNIIPEDEEDDDDDDDEEEVVKIVSN